MPWSTYAAIKNLVCIILEARTYKIKGLEYSKS